MNNLKIKQRNITEIIAPEYKKFSGSIFIPERHIFCMTNPDEVCFIYPNPDFGPVLPNLKRGTPQRVQESYLWLSEQDGKSPVPAIGIYHKWSENPKPSLLPGYGWQVSWGHNALSGNRVTADLTHPEWDLYLQNEGNLVKKILQVYNITLD